MSDGESPISQTEPQGTKKKRDFKIYYKKFKNHIDFMLLVALLVLLVPVAFLFIKRAAWHTYNSTSGFPISDGRFVTLNRIKSHQEPNADWSLGSTPTENILLTFTDQQTESTTTVPFLQNVSQMRTVKVIADSTQPVIWTVIEPSRDCSRPDVVVTTKECSTSLYKFDVTSGKKTLQADFGFTTNKYIIPLTEDPTHHVIWFLGHYDTSDLEDDDINVAVLNEEAIRFNTISGEVTYFRLGAYADAIYRDWSMFASGTIGNRRVADTDRDGNLYFITADSQSIFEDSSTGRRSLIAKLTPDTKKVSLITVPLDKIYILSSGELVIDKAKNVLYLASFAWTKSDTSYFLSYNITDNVFKDMGKQPIRNDSVNGMLFSDGKLLAGFKNGLGIYSPSTNSWRIITSEDGLGRTPVENITKYHNRICLSHDNSSLSCLTEPLWLYAALPIGKKIAVAKSTSYPTTPLTTPAPLEIIDAKQWEIYMDPAGRYSFKYPKAWKIKKGFSTKSDILVYDPSDTSTSSAKNSKSRFPSHYIDILSAETSYYGSYSEVVEYKKAHPFGVIDTDDWYVLKKGIDMQLFNTPENGETVRYAYASTGSNLLKIRTTAQKVSYSQLDKSIESRILDTLKIVPTESK